MGLFNMIDPALDFAFGPIAKLGALAGIAVVSLIITLIITLIYKYVTDQNLMKDLKVKQKDFQKKIKEASKEDPKEAMKIQKEAMTVNMEYMKHSFKPMIFTFIPIIIIFGWLSTNFAYLPIEPGQEFKTTVMFNSNAEGNVSLAVPERLELLADAEQAIEDRKATWALKGPAGEYILFYEYNSEKYSKNVIISENGKSVPSIKRKHGLFDYIYSSSDGFLKSSDSASQIITEHKKIRPLEFTGIPWVKGWGWLGAYILFSIVFSIVIRKVLKVH